MTDIAKLQAEIAGWEKARFPDAPSFLALIKVGEELGELMAHFIGRIETREGKAPVDHQAGVEDAVADIEIALCVFCARERIDLAAEVDKVWAEVSKRTFIIKSEALWTAAFKRREDALLGKIAQAFPGIEKSKKWAEILEGLNGNAYSENVA